MNRAPLTSHHCITTSPHHHLLSCPSEIEHHHHITTSRVSDWSSVQTTNKQEIDEIQVVKTLQADAFRDREEAFAVTPAKPYQTLSAPTKALSSPTKACQPPTETYQLYNLKKVQCLRRD
ncbi:hypothetical protein O3P69_019868 [Scylla paramamosain]|uniref:Uncharacterized protein n=1 Tax=Scylla paramamosain TaxID=85552 RepID=A0AAW0SB40_SCYPA